MKKFTLSLTTLSSFINRFLFTFVFYKKKTENRTNSYWQKKRPLLNVCPNYMQLLVILNMVGL